MKVEVQDLLDRMVAGGKARKDALAALEEEILRNVMSLFDNIPDYITFKFSHMGGFSLNIGGFNFQASYADEHSIDPQYTYMEFQQAGISTRYHYSEVNTWSMENKVLQSIKAHAYLLDQLTPEKIETIMNMVIKATPQVYDLAFGPASKEVVLSVMAELAERVQALPVPTTLDDDVTEYFRNYKNGEYSDIKVAQVGTKNIILSALKLNAKGDYIPAKIILPITEYTAHIHTVVNQKTMSKLYDDSKYFLSQ